MKTQSRKAKGRKLQQDVVSLLLAHAPYLDRDDITSRSMGAGGEDVLLSPAAREIYPISIECKRNAKFAVYKDYEQAEFNAGDYEPVLVIRGDRKKALAVVDLDYFITLVEGYP